jgi:hypothetical protein
MGNEDSYVCTLATSGFCWLLRGAVKQFCASKGVFLCCLLSFLSIALALKDINPDVLVS